MSFDPRTKQIIELFTTSKAYSPFMQYEETFNTTTKDAARKFYEKIKQFKHTVKKRKYHDTLLNKNYEAWYISVKLKHSVIDAFFFPVGDRTKVVILRKDAPYITAAIGISLIAAIILLGQIIISMTLDPIAIGRNFLASALLVGGAIYLSERLTLPNNVRKLIQSFDAEMRSYSTELIDEQELTKTENAEKELLE